MDWLDLVSCGFHSCVYLRLHTYLLMSSSSTNLPLQQSSLPNPDMEEPQPPRYSVLEAAGWPQESWSQEGAKVKGINRSSYVALRQTFTDFSQMMAELK